MDGAGEEAEAISLGKKEEKAGSNQINTPP